MKYLAALFIFVLVGCKSLPEKPETPTVVETKGTVEIDKRLLIQCKEPPKLEGPLDTQAQEREKTLLGNYVECARNNSALVKLVKHAFNIKD